MSQLGEYAQGFYVIIYPLAVLEWNNAKLRSMQLIPQEISV